MTRHELLYIKLLKPLQGKRVGAVIKRRRKHAAKLVSMKIAEYADAPEAKQEKAVIETKEEKFIPETKDFSQTSVRQLADIMPEMTDEDLMQIVKGDERKTAVRLAEEEIRRRVS